MCIDVNLVKYPVQLALLVLTVAQGVMFGLKVAGAVAWPWWLVLSPTWGAMVTFALLFVLLYFILRNSGL